MRRSQALGSIANAIYEAASRECEGRERRGVGIGNGHHMAQKIQEDANQRVAARLKTEVFVDAYALRELVHFIREKQRAHQLYVDGSAQVALLEMECAMSGYPFEKAEAGDLCRVCRESNVKAEGDSCGCEMCGAVFPRKGAPVRSTPVEGLE